jgi:outer membrane lipoprotein SlyB
MMLSDRCHVKHFGILVVCALVLAGCAKPGVTPSGSAVERSTSQREEIARNGTVIKLRAIYLSQERESSRTGSTATTRTVAQVGGAVLGSLAGDVIQEHAEQTDGFEITVRLDNGEIRTVSQQSDVHIQLNQRVQVISGSGVTRVVPN